MGPLGVDLRVAPCVDSGVDFAANSCHCFASCACTNSVHQPALADAGCAPAVPLLLPLLRFPCYFLCSSSRQRFLPTLPGCPTYCLPRSFSLPCCFRCSSCRQRFFHLGPTQSQIAQPCSSPMLDSRTGCILRVRSTAGSSSSARSAVHMTTSILTSTPPCGGSINRS